MHGGGGGGGGRSSGGGGGGGGSSSGGGVGGGGGSGGGARSAASSGAAAAASSPAPLQRPQPPPSELDPFPAHPSGRGVCAEYLSALRACCVAPALLASSPLHARLSALSRARAPPAAAVLVELLRHAFALPSEGAARAYVAPLPQFDLPPMVLFHACMNFLSGLRWEGPLLCAALTQLTRCETPDGAACVVGMMAQASTSCASRRRAALCGILGRLPVGEGAAAAATAGRAGVPPSLAPAAARLRDVAESLIHDTKDRAFDSVFVQPMLLTAARARLAYVELDGDVHGAPTLAAVLLSATGVRVSRVPELNDEATGFTDGAESLDAASLRALWAPEALGRPWLGVRGAKGLRAGAAPQADVFCGWRGSRLDRSVPTVRAFAARAGASGPAGARSRERLASVYLAQFFSYLAEDALLPRLAAALLAAPGGDLDALLPAARAAAGEAGGGVAAARGGPSDEGAGKVSSDEAAGEGAGGEAPQAAAEWLWDMEAFPPTLHVHRVRTLLRLLGVVKDVEEEVGDGGGGGGGGGGGSDASSSSSAAAAAPVEGAPALLPLHLIRSLTVSWCINGGGTGREFFRNLLTPGEEPWNKWVDPAGASRPSWAQLEFSGPVTLTGYKLQSANDFPARDPSRWAVLGTTDAAGGGARRWRLLHEGGGEGGGFTARWEKVRAQLQAPATGLLAVRLEIRELRGGRFADAMQLGLLELEGRGEEGGGEGEGEWECPACTLLNKPCADTCDICEGPRPE